MNVLTGYNGSDTADSAPEDPNNARLPERAVVLIVTEDLILEDRQKGSSVDDPTFYEEFRNAKNATGKHRKVVDRVL